MEELKAMVTAIMNSLIEMTTRAVKAEELEAALRANIDKYQEDAAFWKRAYDRVKLQLDALEAKKNESDGTGST